MSRTMTMDAVLAQRGIDGLTGVLWHNLQPWVHVGDPTPRPHHYSKPVMADGYATSEPVALDHRTLLLPG